MKIDREYIGNLGIDEINHDLEEYQKSGRLTDVYDNENVACMLAPESGGTPESIVKGYFAYRELRRVFCDELRDFIAAVEAADARRDAEEAPLLEVMTRKQIADSERLEVAQAYAELDATGKLYMRKLIADLAAAEAAGIPFDRAAWQETLPDRYQAAQEATETTEAT